MRKHFILLLCLVGLAAPTRLHASQNLIHEVEGFYEKFESSMSAGDYKTTLGLIDKYVAEDFAHYDNGEFTYGKEKFKSIVSENNSAQIGNIVNIDMKNIKYSEETNEILTNFIIKQEYFSDVTQNGTTEKKLIQSVTLECHDNLRILDENTVKLYKCDCTILEKMPIK